MPSHRPQRPVLRQLVDAPVVTAGDGVGRSIGSVVAAVRALESRVRDRSVLSVDLIIGENRIAHQLGRRPTGVTVSPTATSAAFAYAMIEADDIHAVIDVVGAAQPGAGVEVW